MKIAMVIERMDASGGGRETSTAQMAEALVRRGHEVTILCRRASGGGEGVEIRLLDSGGLLRVCKLRHFVADVQQVIRAEHYDVVHATLPIPGANIYQPRGGTVPAQREASFRRRSGPQQLCQRVAEPLNIHRRQMARLERRLLSDPEVLCLPLSRMVARELRRYYGRGGGLRLIYNGVEVPDPASGDRTEWRRQRRVEMGIGGDDPVFLTVAKNFALKGVSETILAFARWFGSRRGRPDARLVVVGRDTPEGYRREARRRGVGAEVVFVPPTNEIFQWYAAADACILLSWYDPCSRVVLEAARWGIPSITTVYNGASELLTEGGGIIVSSPRDTRAVVAGMDELADPQRRAARSEACLKISERISMTRHIDELLKVYAEVAARK